ncbi:MAG TPA: pirin family protein [Planctomycetota bacterium]|nr:pirin family protein [Planctomycetota bacterium]
MITPRKSADRRRRTEGARETWITFDRENRSDPMSGGFRCLESLSEEALAPGADFSDQTSNDIEILTYVCDGSLVQQDPSGATQVLDPGECSRTSFRSGASYRTTNVSRTDAARAFRCLFTPDRASLRTHAEKKYFPIAERRGLLRLILSSNGRNGSLRFRRDGRVFSSVLDPGHHLVHELATGRGAWLQVVSGRIQLSDQVLNAGDGACFEEEAAVSLTAQQLSEILLFDLP